MTVQLSKTTSAAINKALLQARRNQGAASGLVFTLLIVCTKERIDEVRTASQMAGREHPSRTIVVVQYPDVEESSMDAVLHLSEEIPGDLVELHLFGDLVDHPTSVLLPLLLPDLPIVVWWPEESPAEPSADPIGQLGVRRITDASAAADPLGALVVRARHHGAGDTDLVWTRLTPWRALLAAAMEQTQSDVLEATVEAEPDSAPAALLAAWLSARLGIKVGTGTSEGPGITAVRLTTSAGEILIERHDGTLANYTVPGQSARLVALRRRGVNELLTEELRRMDRDDIFDQAMATLAAEDTHV